MLGLIILGAFILAGLAFYSGFKLAEYMDK
ncbi:hypothetical protein PQE71_gp051 [Bacillus phage Izhevsk]|uniref:Uncharacterized protein n=1 Tax=Bacillus phage Izhevsk TaxID=2724322 RepID=A0A6H0X617_9CAUD|nr:hypothetical protein PQE71_gp051 [Bacillus phage Izhevsk]QIW89733.1 hypothetical protein Izhevsk_51 [Bacillus phage Izhevsk]